MTPEDRLRQAITTRTSGVEPSADALHPIEEKLMHAQQQDNRKRLLLGLGAAAAAIAIVVGVVVLADDDGTPVDTVGSTTTTQGTTTSEATTTTTTPTTTSTTVTPGPTVNLDIPVYPDPTTSQRFDDPVAVVTAFARDFVGFTNPVVGPFAAGDSRSGEVEVRGFATGAPTLVLVRQLEDDTWFVIGAGTDSIRLATPAAGATISSPQPLEGMAYAFEGTVQVRLYVDGTQEPIAQTFVTGRGDGELGDFTGELVFTLPPGVTHGVLVLSAEGGEDSAPIQAQVLRVLF